MCLLAGVLLRGALLVAEEKVSAVSELLEKKEKIPPRLEILGEEKALLFFGALLVIWYSWHLFSLADWTRGHQHLCFWSLPMCQCAGTTMSASATDVRMGSVWMKKFENLP